MKKQIISLLLALLILPNLAFGFNIKAQGDILSLSSSTDNTIPRFDGTTGKLLQGSLVTIDDSNNQTIPATKTSIHTFHEDNWNEDDATWTMTGTGPLVHVTGNTTAVTATNTEAIVAGTTYKVTITGTGGTATATYTLGGVTGTTIAATGAIAITDYITASTTASMIITPANTCTVSISAITIEKLTDATGDLTVEGDLFVGSTIKSPGGSGGINILPSGNVGIGTVSPQKMLQVGAGTDVPNLSNYAGLSVSTNGDTAIEIINSTAHVELGFGVTTVAFFGTRTNHSISFQTNGLNYMRLSAAGGLSIGDTYNTTDAGLNNLIVQGNVGIGIATPQAKLDVINTIRITDFYTDASNYEGYSYDAGVTTADTLTIKGITAGTGADNLGFNFTTTGTGVMSHTMSDQAATPVAPTRTTKIFAHTRSLAADGDDACGTTDDCLTLPIPTTMGYLEMWTDGSLYLSAVCVNAGTCTVITDSDAAGVGVEYNAAIASCTGLCLHDGGTNSIIFNDTAGAVTVTVRMVYD